MSQCRTTFGRAINTTALSPKRQPMPTISARFGSIRAITLLHDDARHHAVIFMIEDMTVEQELAPNDRVAKVD